MNTLSHRLGWIIAAIASTVIFAAFSVWGGIPAGDQAGAFWAQVAILFLVVCAFALLLWHLMIRPLAPNLRQPKIDTLPVRLRQGIAVVHAGGALAMIVGGVWDEIWHRQYAIPFGEDFFLAAALIDVFRLPHNDRHRLLGNALPHPPAERQLSTTLPLEPNHRRLHSECRFHALCACV